MSFPQRMALLLHLSDCIHARKSIFRRQFFIAFYSITAPSKPFTTFTLKRSSRRFRWGDARFVDLLQIWKRSTALPLTDDFFWIQLYYFCSLRQTVVSQIICSTAAAVAINLSQTVGILSSPTQQSTCQDYLAQLQVPRHIACHKRTVQ